MANRKKVRDDYIYDHKGKRWHSILCLSHCHRATLILAVPSSLSHSRSLMGLDPRPIRTNHQTHQHVCIRLQPARYSIRREHFPPVERLVPIKLDATCQIGSVSSVARATLSRVENAVCITRTRKWMIRVVRRPRRSQLTYIRHWAYHRIIFLWGRPALPRTSPRGSGV